MKCTRCGQELAAEADFCSNCGARRREVPAPAVRAQRTEVQPPLRPILATAEPMAPVLMERFRDKWVRVGCIGLLALACVLEGVLAAWLLNLVSQPREVPVALPELPSGVPTSISQPSPTGLPASSPSPTLLAVPPTVTPKSSIEPAAVAPYCSALDESPVHVRQNQPITIEWAWVAITASQVQDHLDAATVQVLLDGEEVGPQTQSEIEYDSQTGVYNVSWSADVGTLAPGSHRLDYHAWWSRQISDGWYTYGPGGETEEEHEYCELIVE